MNNEKLNLEALNEVTGGRCPPPVRKPDESDEQYKERRKQWRNSSGVNSKSID